MKVKKIHLEVFYNTVRGTEGVLGLADSRIRDAFLKPLGEATDAMVKERVAIYEKFCDKKEDGTADTHGEQYHFSKEVLPEANKELELFAKEEVEVPFVWGVTAEKLKEIIEKSTYKPKYGETEIIDELTANL